MLTYLHYALATVCFAASVGCLALWIATASETGNAYGPIATGSGGFFTTCYDGAVRIDILRKGPPKFG